MLILIFLIPFYLVGIYLIYTSIKTYNESMVAKDWPTVEGDIVKSGIKEVPDSEGDILYRASATYSYQVGFKKYTNRTIAHKYASTSEKNEHEKILAKLNSGNKIVVRYNPLKPRQSVLSYGSRNWFHATLIFGIFWCVFIIGFTFLIFGNLLPGSSNIINNIIVK